MNRRTMLYRLASLGLVGLGACRARSTDILTDIVNDAVAEADLLGPDCVLTAAQTAGPFYFDVDRVRRDITEGRPGVPLRLVLRIVRADTCQPVPDALVDIWHTDAGGLYSGYTGQGDDGSIDTREQTFMRGVQLSDAQGRVEFDTIYPGWYISRTPHIHIKVHFDQRTAVTSQLYFPDPISRAVYDLEPYSDPARGAWRVTNDNDFVSSRPAELAQLLMRLDLQGKGYRASHTIGIAGV
ncbi:MAG: hypothetical protein GKR89_02620 [Candidatus Latescibacteria bacterium]|nr:hypothetical protein [Candidatus Latescibacterota bacterium]